jgi:hypothetical protein
MTTQMPSKVPCIEGQGPFLCKWFRLVRDNINELIATPPGGGGGDMYRATYDPNHDGKVVSAVNADAVPWGGVTGKPTTFPPAVHNHTPDISETSVKHFGAVGDGETNDTAAIQAALNAVGNGTLYFPAGVYIVNTALTYVGNSGPVNIIMDGALKPASGIGTALAISNVFQGTLQLKVQEGGGASDTAFSISKVVNSNIRVMGVEFAGTVWKVIGNDATGTVCYANTVDYLITTLCGRGFIHGPTTSYCDAFGSYKSIWEMNNTHGSIFQNANDITIIHYENLFSTTNESSLTITNGGMYHIGTLALGGKATYLLTVNAGSGMSIQRLFMMAEDGASPVTKGLYAYGGSDITVNKAYAYGFAAAINYANDGTNIIIDDFCPISNTATIKCAGVTQSYPNNTRGSFAVMELIDYSNRTLYVRPKISSGSAVAYTSYLTAPSAITVGASPFTYTNSADYPVMVILYNTVGVTRVQFKRGVSTYDSESTTLCLAPGDKIIVTHTQAPTMTKIPL